jgi:hypothetical protein
MSKDLHRRMPDGAEQAPGLLLGREIKCGVDRRGDQVEAGQGVVVEVERAVGQDVDLGALEDPGSGAPQASPTTR